MKKISALIICTIMIILLAMIPLFIIIDREINSYGVYSTEAHSLARSFDIRIGENAVKVFSAWPRIVNSICISSNVEWNIAAVIKSNNLTEQYLGEYQSVKLAVFKTNSIKLGRAKTLLSGRIKQTDEIDGYWIELRIYSELNAQIELSLH